MDIIPIRNSERVTFKECRAKWYWAYVERLSARRQRHALEFGTLVHAALAARYKPGLKRGPHPARTFARLYDRAIEKGVLQPIVVREEKETGIVKLDGRELGIAMLQGFVEKYGTDDRYRVIKPEMAFQIDIHDPKTGAYLFTFTGTTDVLVEDLETGRKGYFEWKTSSGTTVRGAPLILNEQANSYWTFGTMYLQQIGIIDPEEDVYFMLYTILRKALPDDRPENEEGQKLNKDGSVSKRQPQPLFIRELVMRGQHERFETARRVMHEAREMQMCREGKLAIYKNPADHCGWCEFRDMCEVHETGSDWRALRDEMFDKWDPYEDHNKELATTIAKEILA